VESLVANVALFTYVLYSGDVTLWAFIHAIIG
jgi:hypothetical protein